MLTLMMLTLMMLTLMILTLMMLTLMMLTLMMLTYIPSCENKYCPIFNEFKYSLLTLQIQIIIHN